MQQNNAIILFSYSIYIYKSIKKKWKKKKQQQQQTTKQKTARPNDEKKDN